MDGTMRVTVASRINDSPRVEQVRGIFDLPPAEQQTLTWEVSLPLHERPWNLGLLVGPSGCGKSTIAKALWPESLSITEKMEWNSNCSILDGFPTNLPIKEVTSLLSSVGFSSPPAWLRPYGVLSTGQQFRVTLARLLADALASRASAAPTAAASSPTPHPPGRPIVFDEYTSVVDRTVAQVGSAAVSKVIRQHGLQFIAVTCHEDVEEWLQPDWVYRPAEGTFTRRSLQRRPNIALEIFRCHPSAWQLFAPHHYLSHDLNHSAVCFCAVTATLRPCAFSAWLPFVGAGPPTRREHRTVCHPDYQGVGIGNALSATIASMWKGLGYRAISTTTHPAMIRSRNKSRDWRMHRAPSFASSHEGPLKHATTRLTAGFEYVGPELPKLFAKRLLEG